jgi:acetamidase/formamidase
MQPRRLQAEVLDIKTGDWGWTAIVPAGLGLLADKFNRAGIENMEF